MKSWIRRSFRNQILVTVLLVTLVPLFLCSVLMLQLQVSRITKDERLQAQQQLDRLEESFQEFCHQAENVTDQLSDSTVVRSVLRHHTADSRTLYQVLSRYSGELRETARFDICFASGECGYTTDPLGNSKPRDPDWGILRAASAQNELVYRAGSGEGFVMEAAKAVRSFDGTILGYLVLSVSRDNMNTLFRGEIPLSTNLMMVDRFWDEIYFSNSAGASDSLRMLRMQLLAGETLQDPQGTCSYTVRQLKQVPFSLILQQPSAFSRPVLHTIRQVSLAMGLLSLGLILVYALHFSRYLSEPVHRMDEAMQQVQRGDLTVRLTLNREDELGRLSESFNRMTEEYARNLDRSVERQKQLNSTRIRMMQAQLNPHFLYNTLDSIKWLGITNGVPEISSMATNLAQILRESISGEEFVTLEQEVEIIDRYLEIQYIRFEDRFVCEVDIPEKFQHCLLPKLSLQPLVENAIIHGVADLEEGYIKLSAREAGDDLILCVSDNGCGIPEEILRSLSDPRQQMPGHHLGLSNVDQIAKLHYGSAYGVSARSVPGEGSEVCLRIPRIRREEPQC